VTLSGQDVLRLLGLASVSLGLCLAAHGVLVSKNGWLRRALSSHLAVRQAQIAFLRLGISPRGLVAAQAVWFVAALTLAILWVGLAGLAATALPLVVGPWLRSRCDARLGALDAQLSGWLVALARSLSSATSLGDALEESTSMVDTPLREEIEHLTRELSLGLSVAEGLERMSLRVGSATLSAAVAAIRIGLHTGGGLSSTLASSAETLREMARLEGVVRARTAEGRAQANVVAALPFPMVAGLHLMNPGLLAPLAQDERGAAVVAVALSLWLTSFVLARSILNVDI